MLAGYLRGLLKPAHAYGLRSAQSETIILEGLTAEKSVAAYESMMAVDAAMVPVLTEKSIRETMHSIAKRASRCMELRLMDIYRMNRRLSDETAKSGKKELSLYQLYQIAARNGIFAALRQRHNI